MQLSFAVLGILIAACIAGSVMPQGVTLAAYMELYGEKTGRMLFDLGFDHLFTCPWFVFLTALLCFNLIFCSVSRLPALIRAAAARKEKAGYLSLGMFGSWITHVGILMMIISFACGQVFSTEYEIYGIAGSSQPIGDTGLVLSIDSFDVLMREDFTVDQYVAGVTVSDADGRSESGTSSVNHPFSAFGYKIYQDSTGWAAFVDILKGEEVQREDLLCAGEYTWPDEMPGLVFLLNKVYPDLAVDSNGAYISATPLLNNPHFLYSIYYGGRVIDMNMAEFGSPVGVADYHFIARDPCEYTLLVIKHDPSEIFVLISALIIVAGLFIAFYIKPMEERRGKSGTN